MQHGGREGEQEQVTMCSLEDTVCFSPVIDRQSFSSTIVRGLCDTWRKMNSVTFVTDEQNALSLCPPEGQVNLVVVRIRCLPLRHMQLICILVPLHLQMSSRTSRYVKDVALCHSRQCEPWAKCTVVVINGSS